MTNKSELDYESQLEKDAFNLHACISMTNARGDITYVNQKFCELSGYSADELLGQNHRILLSAQHPDSFYEEMWQTISSGQIWEGEICNKSKARECYWVKATIVPCIDKKGEPDKYICYQTDVTSLKRNNDSLSLTLEATGDAIWEWNIETGSFNVTPRYEAMLGYDTGELKPTIDAWVESVHPDDLESVQTVIYDYLDGKRDNYYSELRLKAKDGSWRWIYCRGKVILRDKDNKPITMMGLHTDITDEKNLKDALYIAKEKAELANQAKSTFLTNMNHELRTPLNSILGFAQLLASGRNDNVLSATQRDRVETILSSGQYLLSLIDDILELAAIESGKISLAVESVDLSKLISEVITLVKPAADTANIKVNMLFGPKLTVEADYRRLKQVLLNLITNAIKYNRQDGSVLIQVEQHADQVARIKVTDTGIGISTENQQRVFEPFNRLGYEASDICGSGIGLSVTRELVKMMNGTLGFSSEENVGSKFWVDLKTVVDINDNFSSL